jgi:hypothetical protein
MGNFAVSLPKGMKGKLIYYNSYGYIGCKRSTLQ